MSYQFKKCLVQSLSNNDDDLISQVNLEKQQDSYRRDVAVDTDVLPFGRFDRDRLLQAKQLLDKIGSVLWLLPS